MTSLHWSFRASSAPYLIGVALLAGCQSSSPPPPGSAWYRGTVSVDPSAASVFGPGGDVAIEWKQDPARGLWLWREYRSGGWKQDTIWEVGGGDLAPGQFAAGDSSGSWKGTVTLEGWQGTSIWMPSGWHYRLSLSDGGGTLTGTGNTSGGGYDNESGGNDPSDILRIWIVQEWIRPDGTSVGRMRQTLSQINAEEFRTAAERLGGTP